MDLQMWAAVLGDFLFPSRRTAGKVLISFVSEMNLQHVNNIGEMLTNMEDLCPFVSIPSIRYYNL